MPHENPPAEQPHSPYLVPSSIDVVENFFGESLGPKLIEAAGKLPLKQVAELMNHMNTHRLKLMVGASNRAKLTHEFEPTPGTHYKNASAGPIYIQEEALLQAGITTRLSEVGMLKYLALYCERSVVADPLRLRTYAPGDFSDPVTQEASVRWTRDYAAALPDRLRQLLPIAGLVRSGCFILSDVDSKQAYGWDEDMYNAIKGLQDPYLWWLTRHSHRLKTSLNEGILDAYPLRVNSDDLWTASAFSQEIRLWQATPFTANPLIRHHLLKGSQATLAGDQFDDSTPLDKLSVIAPNSAFGIPSLADVQFEDITLLRSNEAVFYKFRTALNTLAEASGETPPGDYDAYRRSVDQHAEQIVRPILEELRVWHRRAKRGAWGSKALGKAVALAVDAVAGGLPVGDLAGRPVERATGKRARKAEASTQLACTILQSIFPAESK